MDTRAIATIPQAIDPVEIRMNNKRFPRLHTIPAGKAIEEIAKAITTASFYNGNKMTQSSATAIATALHLEFFTNAEAKAQGVENLSMTEIASIIRSAILARTDIKNISVAVLFRAVVDWTLNEGAAIQQEARIRYKKQNPNPLQELCEALGQQMIKANQ